MFAQHVHKIYPNVILSMNHFMFVASFYKVWNVIAMMFWANYCINVAVHGKTTIVILLLFINILILLIYLIESSIEVIT